VRHGHGSTAPRQRRPPVVAAVVPGAPSLVPPRGPSSFVLRPSSFVLRPSSFVLRRARPRRRRGGCVRTDCARTDCVRTDCVRTDCIRTDCVRTDCVRTDSWPWRWPHEGAGFSRDRDGARGATFSHAREATFSRAREAFGQLPLSRDVVQWRVPATPPPQPRARHGPWQAPPTGRPLPDDELPTGTGRQRARRRQH
jgi:hypothetical protein